MHKRMREGASERVALKRPHIHCATPRAQTFGHVPARVDAGASYAAEVERVFEIFTSGHVAVFGKFG